MKYSIFAVLIISILMAPSAFARGGLRFGDQDSLNYIQDIDVKGPNGEALYLGHHVTTKFFIAGVYLTDKGYVAALKGDENQSYFPLTSEQIEQFQTQGLLPSPLPSYKISGLQYAIGYSLWLIILSFVIYYGIKSLFKKNDETA